MGVYMSAFSFSKHCVIALGCASIPFLGCKCACMFAYTCTELVSSSLRMPAGILLKLWGPGRCRQESVCVFVTFTISCNLHCPRSFSLSLPLCLKQQQLCEFFYLPLSNTYTDDTAALHNFSLAIFTRQFLYS